MTGYCAILFCLASSSSISSCNIKFAREIKWVWTYLGHLNDKKNNENKKQKVYQYCIDSFLFSIMAT